MRLESEQITLIAVHNEIHGFLGHRRVDHQARREREWGSEGEGTVRIQREVPPDAVRGWIRPDQVFERAGGDFIIGGGVTPSTDARTRIIEEFRVVEIMCIWAKTTAMRLVVKPTSLWYDGVENT